MANDLETSTFGAYWPLFTWTNILLVANAILGIVAFEWAWYKTGRFRNPIQELDAQFPEIRRFDAPKWAKWKHYPGAVTLMIPRILICLTLLSILIICLSIFLIGHNRDLPITGFRKFLTSNSLKLITNLMCIVSWFTYMGHERLSMEDVNHYEEYLGPVFEQGNYQHDATPVDDRVPKRGIGPSSTVICNHVGFMEILNLVCCPLQPSFTPKADLKHMPFINKIADGSQAMYVERGGSKEARDRIV